MSEKLLESFENWEFKNNEKLVERFCDCYKKKIGEIIDLENLEEIENEEIQNEKTHTLTVLLEELCRMEEYCDDQKLFEDTFLELQDKVESIIFVLNELDKRAEGIKAEIDKLKKTREVVVRRYENLNSYLSESLLGAHFNKFATRNYVINFRKSESLQVLADIDQDKLEDPEILNYIRQTADWNKLKIKEDMKNNELPEKMLKLVELKTNLNMSFRNRTK